MAKRPTKSGGSNAAHAAHYDALAKAAGREHGARESAKAQAEAARRDAMHKLEHDARPTRGRSTPVHVADPAIANLDASARAHMARPATKKD